MKKAVCCCLSMGFSLLLLAQAPYLGVQGGDGLGQYGYLEKDAVTFARLERNTYNNIAYLSARWWLNDNDATNGNGKEFIYHVYNGPDWVNGIGWQCGGDNFPSKRTTDFSAIDFTPEWHAGTDCYVSVCARYCDDSYSPASFDGVTTNGAAGFNERHFQVLDVDTSAHISTANIISNSGGICQTTSSNNVAGSFTIDPAALSGLAVTSLILQNNGTALEGTDIPNAAFSVYYEPATGSELFGDGNELYAGNLSGDWNGSVNDNIFGSNGLNIPLSGKIRIYVLLCSFNSPAALNKVINLGIVNDGIFLSPGLDGFTKMRINAGSISQRDIVLPVRFISFTGMRRQDAVQLKWQITPSESIRQFSIEQSYNARDFTLLGELRPGNSLAVAGTYQYSQQSSASWFRVIATDASSNTNRSAVVYLRPQQPAIQLLSNIGGTLLKLNYLAERRSVYMVRLLDVSGRCLLNQSMQLNPGINSIALPTGCSGQLLLLQLQDLQGEPLLFKLLR